MVYAVGRMNEGNRALLERVERTLTRIVSDPQMGTHSATQELVPQLQALRDALDGQRRSSDVLALASVVWKAEDALNGGVLCTALQTGVTRRVVGLGLLSGVGLAATGIAYIAGLTSATCGSLALATTSVSVASKSPTPRPNDPNPVRA